MQCADVAELLLAPEGDAGADVDQHVASCARCAPIARGVARLNTVLASALVMEPPMRLQLKLQQLVIETAQPRALPWWRRALNGEINLNWLSVRPNVFAAQGLATLMVALASWQIYGWVTAFRPVV